jgi:hypothetical protein
MANRICLAIFKRSNLQNCNSDFLSFSINDIKRIGLSTAFLFFSSVIFAQNDSLSRRIDTLNRPIVADSLPIVAEPVKDKKVDSVVKVHSPRKAIIRSAIIPGWGQIYNKKYWKLPIVYGALGVSGGVFVSNLTWYRRTRYAYKVLFEKDTANYRNVHRELQVLIEQNQLNGLLNARDEYRRYVDYSALVFLLLWGLNVVDAAVDAHLKSFDVSPDLSMKLKPGFSTMAGTGGISLVFNFK